MAVTDKLWDAITTVIKMNDKIERMAAQQVALQQKVEDLTGRLIRLETALELGMVRQTGDVGGRQIDHKG